jgi:hypothetical protein
MRRIITNNYKYTVPSNSRFINECEFIAWRNEIPLPTTAWPSRGRTGALTKWRCRKISNEADPFRSMHASPLCGNRGAS